MPAVSTDQRKAMAIAKHAPGKLFPRNRSLLKMADSDLEDYASTPEKGLPKKKGPEKKRSLNRMAEGKC